MEPKRERLLRQAAQISNSIGQLTALAKGIDVTPLERIHGLSVQVPTDLMTKGSRLVPGGFNVRDLLHQVTVDALGDVKRKATATAAALKTARQQLAQVETALKEFE
jgi:hypothetical protein